MEKFKIGNQVRLKSGSPIMTITKTEYGKTYTYPQGIFNEITCTWFADEVFASTVFPAESLELVTAEKANEIPGN